jgi:peptidyl-prolyl cis-trans isomerase SurA
MIMRQALELIEAQDQFDVWATVHGGGKAAQAEAMRHGISRALIALDPEKRPVAQARGLPHARRAEEGAQEVRSAGRAQALPVLQAEEQHADRSHIAVTPEEIDRGIENIAAQAQAQQGRAVTPADVFEEVHRRGLSEQDFRDEIRRQILEGKLVELRVRPRVRVTDNDARSAYQHWVQQLRDQEPVDVRILALRVPPMATKLQMEARTVLAQEIVGRARDGEDFCRLVAQYSDDVSTKDACGSHGAQPIANLLPPIQEAIHTMKPGTISDPIPVAAGQEEVIVILMPLGEARVPPFEDVKSDMTQRALLEGLERARKQWLQELRRNVYIDVRL